jgi:uncharacterized membrane protein
MITNPSMSKERIETFSDGVFAILLTLLVLELRAPHVADHASLRQYAAAMTPLIPKIVSFILTFVILCIYWVNHHYLFRHIQKATIGLVWLNNCLLLSLCFLPFPTAMLGDHPTDQFPILLYGANSLLASLIVYALRGYVKHARLLQEDYSNGLGPQYSLPGITCYGLSIILAFVSVYLSLICFFIVPLLYFIPKKRRWIK